MKGKNKNGTEMVMGFIPMFMQLDVESFFQVMKSVIHEKMFETKADYEYFMDKVRDFAEKGNIIITLYNDLNELPKEERYSVESFNKNAEIKRKMDEEANILKDLESRFPKQLQSFILANLVFISKLHAKSGVSFMEYLEQQLKSRGELVSVEIFNQAENGYNFMQIASNFEMDTEFLLNLQETNDIYGVLRSLTSKEWKFLNAKAMSEAIKYLPIEYFWYSSKEPQYAKALYFNIKSAYMGYAYDKKENNSQSENNEHGKNDSIYQDIYLSFVKNIQYIDLEKLQILLLYNTTIMLDTAIKYKESEIVIESLKNLLQELLEEYNQLRNGKIKSNVKVKFEGFSFEIINPSTIKFKENANGRKICILDDSEIMKIDVERKVNSKTEETLEISAEEIIRLAKFVLAKVKVKEILDDYENGNLVTFDLDLNQNINVDAIIEVIYDIINEQYPGASPDEINKRCFAYSKVFITYLYRNKLAKVSDMIRFDVDSVCKLIIEGVIEMPTLDLKKNGFSKDAIKYLCVKQPERIMECINNGYITKEKLLDNSPIEFLNPMVLQELYKNGLLTINEIFEFVALERVNLDTIKQINFDEERLKSDLNPETLAELYIEIVRKRTEYEDVSRKNIEEQLAQGVKEADIKPSEEELRLQKELQVLNSKKYIYIYLLKYLEKNGIDNNEFYENVFLEAFGRNDDTYGEFLEVVEEMYKDEVVSIDLLKSNDLILATKLMQKGVIRPRDRKKFKDLIIGGEEGKIDLKPEEVEENKDILENMKDWTSQELVIYSKLKAVIEEIINNNSITNAEKMGRIYNILDGINKVEDLLRRIYENKLLKDGIDGISISSTSSNSSPKQPKSSKMKGSANNNSNNYLYPAHIIWKFMEILDPDVYREGYVDGHVVFRLPKLDSVIIENMWKKGKDGRLSRSYGSATIAMDLGVFGINKPYITIPCNKGMKIDRNRAKALLPTMQTSRGQMTVGVIRHEKDLTKCGRKDWFDSLLDYFRISLGDIRAGRDGRYTSEDADKIEEFLKSIREVGIGLYERL